MSSVQQKREVPKQDEFSQFFDVDCTALTDTGDVSDSLDVIDVSVTQAADMLGITVRSVWRRIQKKQLPARLEQGKTIVSLRQRDIPVTSSDTDRGVSVDMSPSQSPASELTGLLDVISHLQLKLEAASYRNGYLESAHTAATEQLKSLPDYMSKAAQAEIHQARIQELEKEVEQLRKPFWLRLFQKQ